MTLVTSCPCREPSQSRPLLRHRAKARPRETGEQKKASPALDRASDPPEGRSSLKRGRQKNRVCALAHGSTGRGTRCREPLLIVAAGPALLHLIIRRNREQ